MTFLKSLAMRMRRNRVFRASRSALSVIFLQEIDFNVRTEGKDMSDIATRLREERKRLGLSQREMGCMGGVAANAQGKYESGERVPKADYLAAVANVGVDILYVLTDRRAVAVEVDSQSGLAGLPAVASELMLGEVQQAVRQLVNTIEELSNAFEPPKSAQGSTGQTVPLVGSPGR